MTRITIVVGYRDRDLERADRCLASLAGQTFKDLEVIFVDYGSSTPYAQKAVQLVQKYPFCHYVYSDTRGQPWSRSKALNIGIRKAGSETIMTTDIDMVFPPNFIQVVMGQVSEKRVLYCATHFLPKGFNDWDRLESYKGKLKISTHNALGGCQVLSAKVLNELRGFDEFYSYWGTEDRDLNRRLRAVGLETGWLTEHTSMFHQWHSSNNYASENFIPDGLWGRAQVYFQRHLNETKRNLHDWGKIQTSSERSVFKFLDMENNRLIEGPTLTIFNEPPENNVSAGNFVVRFWDLPSGHAIAVDHAFFPYTTGWRGKIFSFANDLVKRTENRTHLGWQPNKLHAFLAEFIEQNHDLVADHYLGFPVLNGVSIIVKA
jgi:glycosyltransferase involved in cell wall biosynthesis